MARIVVYGKLDCKYCNLAKNLLQTKNLNYDYIELDTNQAKDPNTKYITREELLNIFPNAKSLPQIVMEGLHIGGYTELEKHLRENYL